MTMVRIRSWRENETKHSLPCAVCKERESFRRNYVYYKLSFFLESPSPFA